MFKIRLAICKLLTVLDVSLGSEYLNWPLSGENLNVLMHTNPALGAYTEQFRVPVTILLKN